MSLRGSKTTEAISQGIDNPEIATLPSFARNDKKGIATQPLCQSGVFRNKEGAKKAPLDEWPVLSSQLNQADLL